VVRAVSIYLMFYKNLDTLSTENLKTYSNFAENE